MKYRSIDRLFRDRLEQHDTQPADGGWDRLESMLDADEKKADKKKRGLVWYSAAAAILLIGFLYMAGTGEQAVQTAGETGSGPKGSGIELAGNRDTGTKENKPVAEDHAENTKPDEHRLIASEAPAEKPMNAVNGLVKAETPAKPARGTITKKAMPDITNQDYTVVAAIDDQPDKEALPVLDMQDLPYDEETEEIKISLPDISVTKIETAVAVAEDMKRQPVTISYVDAPDSKEQKRLSVKRIIGLAKDIKDGDVGIGDLRQAKENLFAGRLPGRSSTTE